MKKANINRRQFLASLVTVGVAPELLAESLSSLPNITKKEYVVSAQGRDTSGYSITGINRSTNVARSALTNFRGHGLAQNPVNRDSVILFARRPGRYGVEMRLSTGEIKNTFTLSDNRNLQGHGCFSADGNLLYTAEADTKTGEGKIVVRETKNYKQLSEIDSYGIGPHDMKLMPDGKTLVVANGGILTRPETGRTKLNLHNMHSTLTYIDLASTKKLEAQTVAETKASIRHLDVATDGTVAFAMQVQREATGHQRVVSLAAVHKRGEPIRLLDKPEVIIEKMHDYIGSVAINNQTRTAGFTSPRGNLVAFWNIDDGKFAGYHQLHDVCGICVSSDQKYFIISNSLGEIRQLNAITLKENQAARLRFPDKAWDNHMISAT